MFAGESCYLGIDLANKLDLNSVVPVFCREIDGVKHFYAVGSRFYVPEETILSPDPDKQRVAERYQSFVNQGALTPTDGAEVDYRVILADILKLQSVVKIEQAPIDPYGATGLLHPMADEGITAVIIQQNYTNMSDPMREIEAALAAGRFHHDGNPILTWCFQNVVGKYLPGSDDVVRPTKQGDENKIDGAVSTMMGVGRAIINEPRDFLSSLSDEDLIIYDS